MLKADLIQTITRVLESYEKKILFAYLFGSIATGENNTLSDVDIALYGAGENRGSYFDLKLSVYTDLCRALKRNSIDVVVLNSTVNLMLLDDIVRSGVVVYECDPDARTDFELKVLHQSIDFRSQRAMVMGL